MPLVWILGGVALGWVLGDNFGSSHRAALRCTGALSRASMPTMPDGPLPRPHATSGPGDYVRYYGDC